MEQNPYHILLIEDDEEDYIIIKDLLADLPKNPYRLHWVNTIGKGRKAIQSNHYDAYLVDYLFDKGDGLDLIREADTSLKAKAPFIFLTGKGSIEIDRTAMEAGAADYLVKSMLTPYSLDRALRYNIRHIQNLKEIRELNKNLEAKVEERTKELAESLEKEKELSEMKSRFVSMASHEFRTPLSTILSSVSLIEKHNQKDTGNEKISKHAERIQSAVNHLNDILNDFLSLEKLEEGAIQPHINSFDVKMLAQGLIEDMQGITKNKQTINHQHFGNKTYIKSDKQLLRNVINNLLSNAIKYSPENSKIGLITDMESGDGLKISVKDEGIGIPEEEQKNLFTRFFRAKNVMYYQGTGLGLNIVQKYVKLLDGTIAFNSKENQGTTIHVWIPQNH